MTTDNTQTGPNTRTGLSLTDVKFPDISRFSRQVVI